MSAEAVLAVPALAEEFGALAGHAEISETGLRFVGQTPAGGASTQCVSPCQEDGR